MNKNSAKYLQGIGFSQLTLTKNTEMKNLGRATPDWLFLILIKQNTDLREKI
jgi:hypothetical protein